MILFSLPALQAQRTLGDTVVPIEVDQGELPPVTAQYASAPKSTHHYYTHSDLVNNFSLLPADSLKLVVTPEPQPAYCAPHEVLEGTLYIQLALGIHDYTFGETELLDPFVATVTVRGYAGGVPVGSPYLCTMNLTTLRPEQVCRFDVSDQLGSVEYFKVESVTYSYPVNQTRVNGVGNAATTYQNLLDSLRLHVYYKEKITVGAYKKDVDPTKEDRTNPVILEVNPIGQNGDGSWFGVLDNPVTFSWNLPAECGDDEYPSYQIQILRLFNRDPDRYPDALSTNEASITETIDWSRALSFETGPLLDENGDQVREVTLTVAEGRGYYVWRVRPIGDRYPGGIANDRNWGQWSIAPADGQEVEMTGFGGTELSIVGESPIGAANPMRDAFFFYLQFDEAPPNNIPERNWAFSRVFTEGEEGTRIHEAMSYVTPMLRGRQSQVHLRSENKMLVSESLYDLSGRAVVNTLAAPMDWNGFSYQEGFASYGVMDFDSDDHWKGEDPSTPEMTGVVADYYSDLNSDIDVPSAHGFPFSRVRFRPDGRVAEVGDPGKVYRIGGKDQTEQKSRTGKTFYAQASEDELLAMFGDETPDVSSVRTIYRTDPNKVTAVQYVSKNGQTLATALVKASSNPHLDVTLPDEAVYEETSETTVGGWSVDGTDRVYSTSIAILADGAGEEVHLAYELDAAVFEGCSDICETCHYKVRLKIYNAEDPSEVHYDEVKSLDGLIGELCPNIPDPLPHITIETINDPGLNNNPDHLDLIDPFNEAGNYTVEFRIITDQVDPGDGLGRTYAEISEANYRQAVSDEIRTDLMAEINGYLDDAELSGQDGLYEWLWLFVNTDPNDDPAVDLIVEASPAEPTTLDDVESFVVTSSNSESCWSIDIPVLVCPDIMSEFDANDDGQITVGPSDEIDFEGMLPAMWGGTENYEYVDEEGVATGRTFPTEAWKYFYYDGQHLSSNTPFTNNGAGAFNALVQNMLDDPDPNVDYTFEELYYSWLAVVEGYPTFATTDNSGDPAKLDVGFELIEEFLQRVGKVYEGISDCPYGNCTTGKGYIDYAYKYFEYDYSSTAKSNCEDLLENDIDYGGTTPGYGAMSGWGADPREGDKLGEDTPGDASDDKKWERLYQCVRGYNRKVESLASRFDNCECEGLDAQSTDQEFNDCILKLRDQTEDECRSVCELRADGFRSEALRLYHDQNIYASDEENIPGGATLISPLELECVVQAMIDECEGNCELTASDGPDTDSRIDQVGTETEYDNMANVFSRRLTLADASGGCTAPLSALTLGNDGVAESVTRLLNKRLREYRKETRDAYFGKYNSNQLRQAFIDITGVTPGAGNWNVYTYLIDNPPATPPVTAQPSLIGENCCSDNIVPANGAATDQIPGIFDFGPDIRAEFIVYEDKPANNDYRIVLRTWCNRNGVEYMQEAEICTSFILPDPCSGSVCFEWKDRVIPADTRLKMPFTCEQKIAMRLRAEINGQIDRQVEKLAAEHRVNYAMTCLNPRGLRESKLTLTQERALYHFTLYYYDRAGRLVRTVPPAGVNLLPADQYGKRDRSTATSHELISTYEYNSLGQLVAKASPDGGAMAFVYDDAGRIRFSQDAGQNLQGKYSYTRYDYLSRVVEVGQCGTPSGTLEDAANDVNFPVDPTDNPEQRTYTRYTTLEGSPGVPQSAPSLAGTYIDGTSPQRYTLNRVAHVYTDDGVHTYYSYDPHGNVEWVQQDLPGLGLNYARYEYDLISGDMLMLHYNEGWRDGFKHAWVYDKDNRLVEVKTSRDGIIWESDARYGYYLHGPWRRVEYGEDSVQGRDYVYTLQGWLKGINHPSLDKRGNTMDPGKDGNQGAGLHPGVAYDAFGMMLEYFKGDFTRSYGGLNSPFRSTGAGPGMGQVDRWHLHGTKNLYNGNIASWTSNTHGVFDPANPMKYDGDLTGYTYQYDVLNRLRSGTFKVYSTTSSLFVNPSSPGEYNVAYTYDPNGNIKTLDRNGPNAVQMDQLSYEYYPGEGQNRLRRVTDGVTNAATYTVDIDDQPLVVPGNPADPANDYYVYDAIGNLVEDKAEGTDIGWSVYGKVLSVIKAGGEQLSYIYDALGNRVVKTVLDPMGVEKKTFYAYDAGGKVLAVYTKNCSIGPNPNDKDQDGIADNADNCPCAFNPSQADLDGDGFPPPPPGPCPPPMTLVGGNDCDDDVDNPGGNVDGNGSTGTGVDPDDDNDGIPNLADPCPLDPTNPDNNGDGIPDCVDIDGDGINNEHDNCPFVKNPGQEDENHNDIGDACECQHGVEWVIYGNGAEGRIGVVKPADVVRLGVTGDPLDIDPEPPGGPGANINGKPVSRTLGEKSYELNDHLGNVRVVISDVKLPADELNASGQVITNAQAGEAPYKAKLHAVNNYYPFGMLQPERHWSTETHRYGFNGKEMDNEWNDGGVAGEGTGNVYDYGFRIYDPRLGRFMSVDPLASSYPWFTPYQYASNTPIRYVDVDGLEGDDNPLNPSPPKEMGNFTPTSQESYTSNGQTGTRYSWDVSRGDYMRAMAANELVGENTYTGVGGGAVTIPDGAAPSMVNDVSGTGRMVVGGYVSSSGESFWFDDGNAVQLDVAGIDLSENLHVYWGSIEQDYTVYASSGDSPTTGDARPEKPAIKKVKQKQLKPPPQPKKLEEIPPPQPSIEEPVLAETVKPNNQESEVFEVVVRLIKALQNAIGIEEAKNGDFVGIGRFEKFLIKVFKFLDAADLYIAINKIYHGFNRGNYDVAAEGIVEVVAIAASKMSPVVASLNWGDDFFCDGCIKKLFARGLADLMKKIDGVPPKATSGRAGGYGGGLRWAEPRMVPPLY